MTGRLLMRGKSISLHIKRDYEAEKKSRNENVIEEALWGAVRRETLENGNEGKIAKIRDSRRKARLGEEEVFLSETKSKKDGVEMMSQY